jgi:hypothetical protein
MATSQLFAGQQKLPLVNRLLKDIARRVQLAPSDYRLAVERYQTIDEWLNRPGGLLAPHMVRLYPQGSMAIGGTISSRLKNDEFDIDVVAELSCEPSIEPALVLDVLFEAMNGEEGTRYYGKVQRRSRCVTVEYDRMHMDITPAVLLPQLPDRTSVIFHAHEKEPPEAHRHIVANPWGFANWFENSTPATHEIVEAMLRKMAEPVPDQDEIIEKSHPLVALQLLKRYRNKRYDNRECRCPPSVVIAYFVATNPTGAGDLYSEFRAQAENLFQIFADAVRAGELIHVVNPACATDVLSDRWPGDQASQRMFLVDLSHLITKLNEIEADPTVERCASILSDLFGENVTRIVVEDFRKNYSAKAHSGGLFANGGLGGLALGASGLGAAVPVKAAYAIPKHTNFGSDE